MTAEQPNGLATDVYVAGYPLVVSTRTYQRTARANGRNRLVTQTELLGPRHRAIVAPNRDTLYALAVLDLRAGPLVFTHPAVPDRYFSYQLMDMWTESFAYVGTRMNGGQAGHWVITPPGWTGETPDGAELIEAPTPQLFLLGRYLVDDDGDVANVIAITEQTELAPLASPAADKGDGLPPAGEPRGRPQQIPTDGSFFAELAEALVVNHATTPAQIDLFERWDGVDLAAGDLDAAAAEGHRRIVGHVPIGDPTSTTGWRVDSHTGRYGDDLLRRARVARVGWAANVPEESLYPVAHSDADGAPLDGARRYLLTFPAGQLPPVHAFWSLSVYGANMFFAEHPRDRYTIGDRTPDLVRAANGAMHIVLSHDEPPDLDAARPANWLPVPAGPFVLMLRLYLPTAEVLEGRYTWPAVTPLDA